MKRFPKVDRGWSYVIGAIVGLFTVHAIDMFPQPWIGYIAYVVFTIFVMWLLDD